MARAVNRRSEPIGGEDGYGSAVEAEIAGVGEAGAMIDTNDDILLYYNAIWAANSTTESVQCYGALARSSDGTTVQDLGYVLDWDDPSVGGYGDELGPQGAYCHNGTYNVYYLAKGYGVSWGLGVASGPTKESISTNTREALTQLGQLADRILGGAAHGRSIVEAQSAHRKLGNVLGLRLDDPVEPRAYFNSLWKLYDSYLCSPY